MNSNDPSQKLVITPLLDGDSQIQEGSVDLRLGTVFIVARHSRFASIDPVEHSTAQIRIENYQDRVHVPLGESLVLHPGETVLGATVEYIVLPPDLVGMIIGRSSWGRHGLTIATALKVNPGNRSSITLELVNHGRMPIHLYPCLRIGQLVLDHLSGSKSMSSRYDYAIGPEFSRLHQDPEMRFLGTHSYPTQPVIGITGLLNAGKSRVAQYLASRLGFVVKSLSMTLMRELRRHTLSPSSEEKYQFKLQFRKEFGEDALVVHILQEAFRDGSKGIVLDGLDHPAEIRYLQKLPNFRLIAVIADKDWRWQKYNALNTGGRTLTKSEFEKLDRRLCEARDLDGQLSPEADYLEMCIKMADYIIESGRDLRHTDAQIEDFISTFV